MTKPRKPFSIWRFSLTRGLQFGGLLVFIRLIFPNLWANQMAAGFWANAVVFMSMLMINCFFEWFFHRYILHGFIFWKFGRFFRGHEHHHELTPIKLSPGEFGRDRVVINRYPITEPAQYEDATFPAYALAAFWAIFSPIIIPLQLLFPDRPIILGGYAAVTMSMFSYEILHSLEHRPYEWWTAAVGGHKLWKQKSITECFWTKVYGFHHMHHANKRCNESVGGWFGLPVADWVFGTYFQPQELLLHERVATAKSFAIPKPRRLVQWLDRLAQAKESTMIARQKKEAAEKESDAKK